MNDKTKCFMLGEDTETFGKGRKMTIPTLDDLKKELVETCECDTTKEWKKLQLYDASQNKRSFCGNKIVYKHYFLALNETRYKNGKTLWEKYEENPEKMWMDVCKMDRRKGRDPSVRDLFEKNRAIAFFKPSTAKFLTQHFQAKKVFDPCAGWGGRSLGVVSAGAKYFGHDTNPKVKECHDAMWKDIMPVIVSAGACPSTIREGSCLSPHLMWEKHFDLALTSPPYANLEVYEGMTPFKDDDDYYKNFLLPMMKKCEEMVKAGGHLAINISPKIYEKLTKTYKYRECDTKIDFLQQMGQKSGKKEDFVYVWKVPIVVKFD